jgi:hypothetical protein
VIDLELTRARYEAIKQTGREPALIASSVPFLDRLCEEVAGKHVCDWGVMWNGIPVIVNSFLPTDMAVLQDDAGVIVGVIRL